MESETSTTKLAEQPTEQPTVEVLPKGVKTPDDIPQVLRNDLVGTIQKDWKEIVEAQADLAKGVWIKDYVRDKKGQLVMDPVTHKPTAKVYLKPPDRDAGQYLINQVVGKPKENMVVDGKVSFLLDV